MRKVDFRDLHVTEFKRNLVGENEFEPTPPDPEPGAPPDEAS